MLSRRQEIVNHYLQKSGPIKEAAAAAATKDHHLFHGDDLCEAVVVRVDLNGYSSWAQDRLMIYRVNLLNDFFTKVLNYMDKHGGVYFRDEGDCIISLFSSYFGLEDPYAPVDNFCKAVVSARYGIDQLTAKAIVAEGEIAFYQKSNEVGTGDWSAEGEPFIRAIRVEQTVKSEQQIYYFADEYDELFQPKAKDLVDEILSKSWRLKRENKHVQGLGMPGEYIRFAIKKYFPGRRLFRP